MPGGLVIGVDFLFPDRNRVLEPVYDCLTGGKGFGPVAGQDADDHGNVADFQPAGAVQEVDALYLELAASLLNDAAKFSFGQLSAAIVIQPLGSASLMVIADNALEADGRTTGWRNSSWKAGEGYGKTGEKGHHQPPETGGIIVR